MINEELWTKVKFNYTAKGEGFMVSYLPAQSLVGKWTDSDGSQAETALVKDYVYKILNGDFREEYQELIPLGYEACLKFYEERKKEFGSNWTTASSDVPDALVALGL